MDDSENQDDTIVVKHVVHDPVVPDTKPVERVRGTSDGLDAFATDPAGLRDF